MLAEEMTSHRRWDDFLEFHDRNPMVFEWLLSEAHKCLEKGYRLSTRYLFERLRAEGHVEIEGLTDGFVLNNDFVALYASRGLKYEDPSLEPYLETRAARGN